MADSITDGLIKGTDRRLRCAWCGSQSDYIHYHDDEWGRPTSDDHALFEKLCLEGFQSGLSWLTILRKREGFREAFSGFDFERVARYRSSRVESLMQNPGIVRHRGKIEAVLHNAKRARELAEEQGSLAAYVWGFEPAREERPQTVSKASLQALPSAPSAVRLSKDLRKRGWRFVGPTTAYAFMQAMGLVNDHLEGCCKRRSVESERRKFERPRSDG